MNREQKRKLGVLIVLSLALLVSGTFAFTAFNQRAINDRLREHETIVGGRVHDYYNRDTENKDVFVENYGRSEIMARIRLSEFMEIQARGQSTFSPVVSGTSRDDVENWTTWRPSATSIEDRQGDSNYFDTYSDLTFGWERNGQFAPWYLPTFNRVENDERTAAAGHARDWIAGGEATDGVTDGATHPGDGTDAYWSEGQSYDNSEGEWFGSQVIHETAQNLQQQHPVITIQEWAALPNARKIGDFWVVDHETGWAYWASELKPGETTSYLLDAAEMKQAADDINGSYYYGIHVESNLISPDEAFEDEPETGYTGNLGHLLTGIRNNGIDDETGNPPADLDSQPDDFNFSTMNPGRIFTMAGEEYRYLEEMEGGHHMIIRNEAIRNVSWSNQETELTSWYGGLPEAVRAIVAPVAPSFTVGFLNTGGLGGLDAQGWLFTNISAIPMVANDITRVVPEEDGGLKRAFALSLADINRLSGPDLGFPNLAQRAGANDTWWWTRTPSTFFDMIPWYVGNIPHVGRLFINNQPAPAGDLSGGVRPALILQQ